MNNYCPKCGKKVKECTCEEKRSVIKDIKKHIVDFIKKPFDTVSEFVKGNNNDLSYIIILLFSVLFGIFTIKNSCCFFFSKVVMSAMYIFMIIILFTFLLSYLTKKIIKSELKFYDILKTIGVSLIPMIVGIILMVIVNINLMVLFIIFSLTVYSCILFIHGIDTISNVDKNKLIYLLWLALFLIIIVFQLLNAYIYILVIILLLIYILN